MGKKHARYGVAGILFATALALNIGLTHLATDRIVFHCDHSMTMTYEASPVLLLRRSGTAALCSGERPSKVRVNFLETGFFPRDGVSDSEATIFGLLLPYVLAAVAAYLLFENLSGAQRRLTAFMLSGITLLSLISLGTQFHSAMTAHASLIDMFWGTQGARLDWILLFTMCLSLAMSVHLFRSRPFSVEAL
jgi:hypothetical protein